MFKNATIYRLTKAAEDMADAMDSQQFTPLGDSSRDKSVGWVPPREEHGALIESVSGFQVMCLAIETKSVPSSEVAKHVAAAVAIIEENTGRKPGKKERQQLKEDAIIALLPKAFPKRKNVSVMIVDKFVVIDTASQSVADDVISALVRAGAELAMVVTNTQPDQFMVHMLLDEDEAEDFFIGRECELVAPDDSKSKAVFKNHSLMNDNVRFHIQQGKRPTKLAMSNNDGTDFVLTDSLRLRKIKFATPDAKDQEADAFDADVTIKGAAISNLISELVASMGGLFTEQDA